VTRRGARRNSARVFEIRQPNVTMTLAMSFPEPSTVIEALGAVASVLGIWQFFAGFKKNSFDLDFLF
jgi:hypothetical protein